MTSQTPELYKRGIEVSIEVFEMKISILRTYNKTVEEELW